MAAPGEEGTNAKGEGEAGGVWPGAGGMNKGPALPRIPQKPGILPEAHGGPHATWQLTRAGGHAYRPTLCALPLCSESLSINNVPDHRLPLAWDGPVGGTTAFPVPLEGGDVPPDPPHSPALNPCRPHSGLRDADPREGAVAPPKPQLSLEADLPACHRPALFTHVPLSPILQDQSGR